MICLNLYHIICSMMMEEISKSKTVGISNAKAPIKWLGTSHIFIIIKTLPSLIYFQLFQLIQNILCTLGA